MSVHQFPAKIRKNIIKFRNFVKHNTSSIFPPILTRLIYSACHPKARQGDALLPMAGFSNKSLFLRLRAPISTLKNIWTRSRIKEKIWNFPNFFITLNSQKPWVVLKTRRFFARDLNVCEILAVRTNKGFWKEELRIVRWLIITLIIPLY